MRIETSGVTPSNGPPARGTPTSTHEAAGLRPGPGQDVGVVCHDLKTRKIILGEAVGGGAFCFTVGSSSRSRTEFIPFLCVARRNGIKTFPTEVELVWALAHASLMITLTRGLKPTLQGLLSETSIKILRAESDCVMPEGGPKSPDSPNPVSQCDLR